MGCIFVIAAAFAPRLVLFGMWIFGDRVERAFDDGFILPLLGIIFLPFTTLMYVLAWVPVVELGGGRWLWVVLGFLIDIGGYVGTARSRR